MEQAVIFQACLTWCFCHRSEGLHGTYLELRAAQGITVGPRWGAALWQPHFPATFLWYCCQTRCVGKVRISLNKLSLLFFFSFSFNQWMSWWLACGGTGCFFGKCIWNQTDEVVIVSKIALLLRESCHCRCVLAQWKHQDCVWDGRIVTSF